VTIELTEGVTRKFETKTGKKGDFVQIGLSSGAYKVTVEKDKLSQSQIVNVRVSIRATPRSSRAKGCPCRSPETTQDRRAAEDFSDGVEAARAGSGTKRLQNSLVSSSEPEVRRVLFEAGDILQRTGEVRPGRGRQREGRRAQRSGRSRQRGRVVPNGRHPVERAQDSGREEAVRSGAEGQPESRESTSSSGSCLSTKGFGAAVNEFETYLRLAPTGPNAAEAKALIQQLPKK